MLNTDSYTNDKSWDFQPVVINRMNETFVRVQYYSLRHHGKRNRYRRHRLIAILLFPEEILRTIHFLNCTLYLENARSKLCAYGFRCVNQHSAKANPLHGILNHYNWTWFIDIYRWGIQKLALIYKKKIVVQMQLTLSLKLDIRHYNNKWKLYRESIECNNMQMWTTQFDLEA